MILHSYPWYIADWRMSRTRVRMTLAERGLYREILDLCYAEGSVPDDERALCALVGCTPGELKRSWPAVRSQLVALENGDLTHPRVQRELPSLLQYQQARKAKSQSGALARWAKQRAQLEQSAGIATGNAPSNPSGSASGSAPSNARGNAPVMLDLCPSSTTSSTTSTSIDIPPLPPQGGVQDNFAVFWDLFRAAGKALNERDKERALRLWLNLEDTEQQRVIAWVVEQMKSTWSDAKFTPMPYNALDSKGWKRKAEPRILPAPMNAKDAEVHRQVMAKVERGML